MINKWFMWTLGNKARIKTRRQNILGRAIRDWTLLVGGVGRRTVFKELTKSVNKDNRNKP